MGSGRTAERVTLFINTPPFFLMCQQHVSSKDHFPVQESFDKKYTKKIHSIDELFLAQTELEGSQPYNRHSLAWEGLGTL